MLKMPNHTSESVYKTFLDIDHGLYTNAIFSNANVVMLSKESFDALMDAWEKLQGDKE